MASTNGIGASSEMGSSKGSRVASKSGLERSSAGSGLAVGRAIQATNNDTVSVNNSKSTPEKRNTSACGSSGSSGSSSSSSHSTTNSAVESPRKVLRRRVGGKVEEEEEDDSETATPTAEEMSDSPVDDADNNSVGHVDTVCEDVSVAVTGKKNAIRGKVWRARNGDYVRYLCIDDGADYRPGGT